MKKRGFTMVELMIVIAIIAVLASIIMPKMSGAREKSLVNACKSNIRHIATAMEIYANDNQGRHTPCLTSSLTYYYYCSYLTPTYLQSNPSCTGGHYYCIAANHPGGTYWTVNKAGGGTVIFTYPAPCVHGSWLPYCWIGDRVYEK